MNLRAVDFFEKAEWIVDDWLTLMLDISRNDLNMTNDLRPRINDAEKVLRILRVNHEQLAATQTKRPTVVCATAIATMLNTFGKVGAVYYRPKTRRYKITSEDYEPSAAEILVGLYRPGVDVAALTEDFTEMEQRYG
jgi:hypothetical protein